MEVFPDLLDKYARRTVRLCTAQKAIAFALGGQAGSLLASKLQMPISGDALLRMIRSVPVQSPWEPEVIGVDDWAKRRGRVYGTILVDLERHRVIDLLTDPTAETLAQWLHSHPGVKIVARDHSLEYARGISEGMIGKRMSLASILSLWNVSVQTVYNWLDEFARKRWKSLGYEKAPGRPPGLTKTQKRKLATWLEAGPEASGYACGCWTSVMIQDLIDRKFQVLYNRFYVCELLRNLGFSFQKARFVSDHLDAQARQHWMESEWPRILSQAKQLGAALFFGDEASFSLWGSLSYTWGRKGQQPQVPTTGLRKGYKVFGAIEFFTGRLIYQGTEARFQSDSYQSFLQYLLSQVSGTIILIQDGPRYHTSKATREFFDQHKERLTVYQLPSYSPDYNPIEYLWKKVKTQATHNRYFAEFVYLVQSVDQALKVLTSQSTDILRLMAIYARHLADPSLA